MINQMTSNHMSESVLGNYHLGPHSPIAVWAILGAQLSSVGDVCCWVNLQLQRPGPATLNGIGRGKWKMEMNWNSKYVKKR